MFLLSKDDNKISLSFSWFKITFLITCLFCIILSTRFDSDFQFFVFLYYLTTTTFFAHFWLVSNNFSLTFTSWAMNLSLCNHVSSLLCMNNDTISIALCTSLNIIWNSWSFTITFTTFSLSLKLNFDISTLKHLFKCYFNFLSNWISLLWSLWSSLSSTTKKHAKWVKSTHTTHTTHFLGFFHTFFTISIIQLSFFFIF